MNATVCQARTGPQRVATAKLRRFFAPARVARVHVRGCSFRTDEEDDRDGQSFHERHEHPHRNLLRHERVVDCRVVPVDDEAVVGLDALDPRQERDEREDQDQVAQVPPAPQVGEVGAGEEGDGDGGGGGGRGAGRCGGGCCRCAVGVAVTAAVSVAGPVTILCGVHG